MRSTLAKKNQNYVFSDQCNERQVNVNLIYKKCKKVIMAEVN